MLVLMDDANALKSQLVTETRAAIFALDVDAATAAPAYATLANTLGDKARLATFLLFEIGPIQ